MAAVTPATVVRGNEGDTNVIVANFTSAINDTDTWTQTISGYLAHNFTATNNPTTQTSAGVHVAYSSGVFTFYPGENGATGFLTIRVKS